VKKFRRKDRAAAVEYVEKARTLRRSAKGVPETPAGLDKGKLPTISWLSAPEHFI
jgi:hypothetical protein